ncbi:MAG: hypothetical protein ACOVNR_08635 [Chitinophagaceae bacterium]
MYCFKKTFSLLLFTCCFTLFNNSLTAQSKNATPVAKQTKTVTKPTKKTKTSTLTITQADNGKTFHLKKTQLLKVVFEKECVGCAKVWTVGEYNKDLFKLLKDYRKNPSCTNCEGGNIDHIFEFKALKKVVPA